MPGAPFPVAALTLRGLLPSLLAGCIAINVLGGCSAQSKVASDAGLPPQADAAPVSRDWQAIFPDLPSLVLSGWAAGDNDVFFVGSEGLVLRYKDAHWYQFATPTHSTLWWIWGTSENDVYAGGEQGTLLHYDGSMWSRVDIGLDGMQTVWGIWGSGNSDIWVVGGRLRGNGPGFALHGNGATFHAQDLGGALPNLYKVWGKAADDLYFVGDHGIAIHEQNGAIQRRYLDPAADGGVSEALFTVAGNAAGDVLAVGGVTHGLLFEYKDAAWQSDDPQTPGLNGVTVAPSGEAYVVGLQGTIRHRVHGQWRTEDFTTDRHYHSTVLMGDTAFAVGGDLFSSQAARRGLIATNGDIAAGEITLIPNPDAGIVDAGNDDAGRPPPPLNDASLSDASPPPPLSDAAVLADAASEDAAAHDAAPTLLPGPTEPCTADLLCDIGSECWFIQGESQSRCVTPCTTPTDCPPEYGPNPQCAPPGCQTLYTVCMPAAWKGCF